MVTVHRCGLSFHALKIQAIRLSQFTLATNLNYFKYISIGYMQLFAPSGPESPVLYTPAQ
jgi:hypothetical protein